MKKKLLLCSILLIGGIMVFQMKGKASEVNYWKNNLTDWGYGDGIDNASDLMEAIEDDGDIVLDGDIDMSSVHDWNPKDITGLTINGQGHVIKNLTITCDEDDRNVGFFSSLKDSEIINVGFENITITVNGKSNDMGVGIIAGYAGDGTSIDNCYTDGTININSSVFCSRAGGVVGRINNADVSKCSNHAKITLSSTIRTDSVSGKNGSAGGIVGYLQEGSLKDSYNMGAVTSNIKSNHCYLGGLAGYTDATVQNCYNVATVSAIDTNTQNGGRGLCGFMSKDGLLKECYRNAKCAQYGYSYPGNLTLKEVTAYNLEDSQLKLASTYKNWDFENTWAVESGKNQGYPYLKTFRERVMTPEADVKEGRKDQPITVRLTCPVTGASIYYTTNGTMPTENSKRYYEPITIRKNTHLVAVAYKTGMDPSRPAAYDYNYKYLTVYSSRKSGKFQKKIRVRFRTAKGAVLYYSTSGKNRGFKRYTKPVTIKRTTNIWVKAQKGCATSKKVYHWRYKKVKKLAKANSRIRYIRGYHKYAFELKKKIFPDTEKYNFWDQKEDDIGVGKKNKYYDLDGDGKKEKLYIRKKKGNKHVFYINGKKRTTIGEIDQEYGNQSAAIGLSIFEFQGKRFFSLMDSGPNDYILKDTLCIWRHGKFKVLHKMELKENEAGFSYHYAGWDGYLNRKVIYYETTRQYSGYGLEKLPYKARKIYNKHYYKKIRNDGMPSIWRRCYKKYTYRHGKLVYLGKDEYYVCSQGAG